MPCGRLVLIILTLLVFTLLIGPMFTSCSKEPAEQPASQGIHNEIILTMKEPTDPDPRPSRAIISEQSVMDLLFGQSYESVEDRFGIPADSRESEYKRGISGYTSPFTIVWYLWGNPDGSNVRLGFVNNKLEYKYFIRQDGSIIKSGIDLNEIQQQ